MRRFMVRDGSSHSRASTGMKPAGGGNSASKRTQVRCRTARAVQKNMQMQVSCNLSSRAIQRRDADRGRGRMSRLWLAAPIACCFPDRSPRRRNPEPLGAGCPTGLVTRVVRCRCTRPSQRGRYFGFMRVFLRVCDANRRTSPSSHRASLERRESTRRGTFPLVPLSYGRPDAHLGASVSTRINSACPPWRDLPLAKAHPPPRSSSLAAQRLLPLLRPGSDTPAVAESSYTRVRGHAAPAAA